MYTYKHKATDCCSYKEKPPILNIQTGTSPKNIGVENCEENQWLGVELGGGSLAKHVWGLGVDGWMEERKEGWVQLKRVCSEQDQVLDMNSESQGNIFSFHSLSKWENLKDPNNLYENYPSYLNTKLKWTSEYWMVWPISSKGFRP